MIGTIMVEGLEISCIVGIHPHEREEEQALYVDVEIDRDFASATKSEKVDDTVDYVALASKLTELAVKNQYQLIETFAEDAANILIDDFGAERAAVKIMKPAAVPEANWAAVKVERHR